MKTILKISLGLLFVMSGVSCEVSFESTFHNDNTTSMEIVLHIDENLDEDKKTDQNENSSANAGAFKGYAVEALPKAWTNFYEFLKKSGEPLAISQDSIQFLKSVLVKFDTKRDHFRGFSIKINRAGKDDMKRFYQLFRETDFGSDADKQVVRQMEILDAKWDGKKLIIPTGEDPVLKEINNPEVHKSEAEAKEALKFFRETLKGANIVVSYKFVFERKIRKIQGRHDLVKKLNDYSVEYKVDMLDIIEKEAKGQKMKRLDPEIIIWTEK